MLTYTIIIPHKNIPKLLQRCLDSIPCRDDLHIIVVDDNSDPNKVDFNHFPGYDRDDVELIFTKEGNGAGYARNVGLEHAKSKKILFADADDYFNYCLNDILDKYKTDTADIVFFKVCCLDSDYYTVNQNRFGYLNRFINNYDKNPDTAVQQLKYDFGAPWCKMINKSIIDNHHIRFDECIINNDTTFSYLIGYYANNIKVDKHAIYCITFRSDSLTYSIDENKILTIIEVQTNRDKFFKEHHINYKTKINNHYRKMTDLYLSGNTALFNKCLEIFEKKGIRKRDVMMVVYKRLLKEKLVPLRRFFKL